MPTAPAIFEVMKNAIQSEGPELQKQFKGIVEFNVKDVGFWTLDLKSSNPFLKQGQSESKADVIISVSDSDFLSLVQGRLNPQQAFMKGKLKIKGNMGLAMKFNTILNVTRKSMEAKYGTIDSLLQSGTAQQQEQKQEQQKQQQPNTNQSDPSNAQSESKMNISDPIFQMIDQGIKEQGAKLVQKVQGVFQFKLKGTPGVEWNVDLKNGNGQITRGVRPADVTLEMFEEDFVAIATEKLNPRKAFMNGKIKITGKMPLALKMNIIFTTLRPKSRL
jgi:putative sterol carrier protein